MTKLPSLIAAFAGLILVAELPLAAAPASQFHVYFGTYTGKKSAGIYVCRLDAATGKLTVPELAAETPNPTFLAVHPQLPALYAAGRPLLLAANEVKDGMVSAFAISPDTGKLTFLNQRSSRGSGPCHLSVDRSGRCVLVANYGSGSIAALPLNQDGSLGESTAFIQHTGSSVNKQRQAGPHAHWIDTSPDNRFALVCDLGLDKVLLYTLDPAKGALAPSDPAFAGVTPGAGPRHLAFHPNGKFAYVINEMGNTVTAFSYAAASGTLKSIQTLPTLPEGFAGPSSTAEVEVHPYGKFLYGSNRGHDSIAVYAIDGGTGQLTFIEHQSTQGKTPRNFAIDPTGRWLLAANQGTDNVVVFGLDLTTGRLKPTGHTVEVGAPVCVKFVPMK
ncbi:MAG: lactonase family protein [Verrucomicrobia bacterium]|nr:lactonase family protein [Verrucomicrobiota bacterium]